MLDVRNAFEARDVDRAMETPPQLDAAQQGGLDLAILAYLDARFPTTAQKFAQDAALPYPPWPGSFALERAWASSAASPAPVRAAARTMSRRALALPRVTWVQILEYVPGHANYVDSKDEAEAWLGARIFREFVSRPTTSAALQAAYTAAAMEMTCRSCRLGLRTLVDERCRGAALRRFPRLVQIHELLENSAKSLDFRKCASAQLRAENGALLAACDARQDLDIWDSIFTFEWYRNGRLLCSVTLTPLRFAKDAIRFDYPGPDFFTLDWQLGYRSPEGELDLRIFLTSSADATSTTKIYEARGPAGKTSNAASRCTWTYPEADAPAWLPKCCERFQHMRPTISTRIRDLASRKTSFFSSTLGRSILERGPERDFSDAYILLHFRSPPTAALPRASPSAAEDVELAAFFGVPGARR